MAATISFLKGQLLLFFSPFGLCGSMSTSYSNRIQEIRAGGWKTFFQTLTIPFNKHKRMH